MTDLAELRRLAEAATPGLRGAALEVVRAQEAVRDAINGQGHPGKVHDAVLGGIYDLGDGVSAVDEVGGCSACGGAQYGSEDDLNRAYGQLRAVLGLEVRPWEYQEAAAEYAALAERSQP